MTELESHRPDRRAGSGRRRGFRADIQGLRALAVVAVVANHFAGWPVGGYVGVDVFFVISGYLITGILVREWEARGRISFRGFYARRIRRILPVALLVIGATVLATRVLAGIDRYHSTARDAIFAVVFLANWHFASTGINYFAQSLPPSPLQHYWSLSVEEQFYAVWPWMLLALMFGLGRRLSSGARCELGVGVALVVISALSLIWAFHQTASAPTIAYFSTFTRAWELAVGALVATGGHRVDLVDGRVRALVAWLGLAGIIVAVLVIPSGSGFPAPWALLPVLSTAAVLTCGSGLGDRVLVPLTNRLSQYLGRISYSLYLWHFPVTVLIVDVVAKDSAGYWLVGIPLMFGLSMASFHLLEEPARRGVWFRRSAGGLSLPTLGWLRYGAACVAVALLAGLADLAVHAITPSQLTMTPAIAAAADRDVSSCIGAGALEHHCARLDSGNRVAPLPGELPDDTADAYACYAYAGQPIHPCVYGSRRPNAVRVALVGDSHAAALLPALEPELEAMNWRVTAYTGNSCGWVPANLSPTCVGLARMQSDLLHGHYQVVVSTEIRLDATPAADHLTVMRPVAAGGARIVIVEDDPSVSAASTACVQRITYSPTGGCGTPAGVAYAAPDRLAQAAGRLPGAIVVHTEQFYCRDGFCPSTVGNVLVYRDSAAHVTASYAQTVGPYLVADIERALPRALR